MVMNAPGHDQPDTPVELAQAAATEPIGQVSAVDGTVTITRADGTKDQAVDGTPIFQGDLVETTADAAIGITFADESTFSLAEKGSMVIDEMVYDPSTQSGTHAVSIAEGVFTFVSGHIAKTAVDAMVIKTPVAVIGIRGTEGGGRAGPEGTPNMLSLFGGEMTVNTQGGSAVMNSPGHTTQLASSFVPPTKPVKLPPQALQRFFAKAAAIAPKPVFAQQAAPQGDQGADQGGPTDAGATDQGPADAGPTEEAGPAPEAADAVEQAAADAFEQILAGGGSLDDALNAAHGAAAATEIQTALAVNPNAFGSAESGAAIMNAVFDQAFLAVTGKIDVGGAGTGGGNLDRFVDRIVDPGLGEILGPGIPGGPGFGDPFGPGGGDPFFGDPFGDPFGPFDPFGGPFFGDPFAFGPFGPNPFGPDPFFGDLSFDDPFFFDDEDFDDPVTNVFDDFVNGSTGDDVLTGGDGNTRFTMIQGLSLGGTDVLNGGPGTDEIALENLSDLQLIFNASTFVADYADTGSVSGTITLNSVEQVFADDGAESLVRLPLDTDDLTFGYIIAGTSANDTLSAANGVSLTNGSLSGVSGSTISTGNIFGSVIFGGAGNDTITGSEVGDLLFGGAGNDTITLGGDGGDEDSAFGGDGDDTIIAVLPADIVDGSNFSTIDLDGGAGNDTLQLGSGSSGQTFVLPSGTEAAFSLLNFEVLNLAEASTTVQGSGDFFFNDLTEIIAVSSSVVTATDGVLDLSAVNVDADVITISASNSFGGGVSITDSNQATGRTLVGSSQGDNLEGLGGADTIQLNGGGGGDTNVDVVFYRNTSDTAASAGGTTGFDVIQDFETTTDQITIRLNGTGFSDFNDTLLSTVETTASVATNGANLVTLQAAEIVYITSAVSSGNLFDTNLASAISAIGSVGLNAGGAENDAIFVLNDGTDTGIYLYSAGNADTTIQSTELTALAQVQGAVLTDSTGDISFSAT